MVSCLVTSQLGFTQSHDEFTMNPGEAFSLKVFAGLVCLSCKLIKKESWVNISVAIFVDHVAIVTHPLWFRKAFFLLKCYFYFIQNEAEVKRKYLQI